MHIVEPATRQPRTLSVRLASNDADIEAAQRLRWDVFYGDMGATPHAGQAGHDADRYDPFCDHLLVEDSAQGMPQLVGTYRLLRESVARGRQGFYSMGEYDLSRLCCARRGEMLELGRSCVSPQYRDAGTIQLLWRGIATYLDMHNIALMFGCASFPGTDPDVYADALSYLYHNHLAPADFRAEALAGQYVEMARLPLGGYDPRQAMRKLPPLIKGYLRVGAMVGRGAVIDHDFNTVDVFMTMPVDAIAARYKERFCAAA